jgi:hypothetical protein
MTNVTTGEVSKLGNFKVFSLTGSFFVKIFFSKCGIRKAINMLSLYACSRDLTIQRLVRLTGTSSSRVEYPIMPLFQDSDEHSLISEVHIPMLYKDTKTVHLTAMVA